MDVLTIDYQPDVAHNGFESIREIGEDREFVFINEAYVRFASVEMEATSDVGYAYKVYPHGDDEQYVAICEITDGLKLYPNKTFERTLDNFFRKECVDNYNIHEYVFRLYRQPAYGRTDIPEYWGISIAIHSNKLTRYPHSPARTEMLVGEFNGDWTEEEQDIARKFRSYAVSFSEPRTREQFIDFFIRETEELSMDKKTTRARPRSKFEKLWEKRKEMGIF